MQIKKINIDTQRSVVTVVRRGQDGIDRCITIADSSSNKMYTLLSNKMFSNKRIYDIIKDTLKSFIRQQKLG